jgi:hypothetical protein
MKKIGMLAALLAGLLLNGLTLTSPPSASAETGGVTYESGGNKNAAIDLTRLRVRNRQHRVMMVVKVVDLGNRGRFRFYMVEDSPEPVFGLEAEVFRRDGQVVDRFREFGDGWSAARKCADSRVRWARARELIRLSFPQHCFHAPLPDSWEFDTFSKLRFSSDVRSEIDNPRKSLVLDRG